MESTAFISLQNLYTTIKPSGPKKDRQMNNNKEGPLGLHLQRVAAHTQNISPPDLR